MTTPETGVAQQREIARTYDRIAAHFYVAGLNLTPRREVGNPVIDVPNQGELKLWFHVTSRGCEGWDSNGVAFGNYPFPVSAP